MKELEKFGFLQRAKNKNEKGHWEVDYNLYSEPINPADEIPTLENQRTETHSTENPTSENHTNNNNTEVIKKDNTRINTKIERDFFSDDWFLVWQEWLQYKKEIRKPYRTDKSEKAAFKKLVSLSNDNKEIALKIIQQSIENDWVGFFELKNNDASNKKGIILNFD